ncbi:MULTISPECIES: GNAT family N-acetyltransferase [unclassified Oceanispirochaeta]|uniref:GNAT family N-acetyltransferase n=1 Tax=unclassified Oceanispirochaeta TaxID=2635722 RepID=UPI001313D991|nr:GNAT family N-acetyltransferase [Oceanispirochaeta sp. M1]MBF9017333.1 GNAT family N-acetyltransferase [Oceanispirochaeta sp. M2]NPD73708.1 GNAT family N-acetyltransferase [Oceanispirochaeta sp. M1]
MFNFYIKEIDQCTSQELSDFKNTLLERSEINSENIDKRILRTKFLAFHYLESKLIGIGAIKSPSCGYRNRILAGQDTPSLNELPDSEIGWFYVHNDFQGKGIGGYILSELLKKTPPMNLFAVTEYTNREARHLLAKNNFSFSSEINLNKEKVYLLYSRNM